MYMEPLGKDRIMEIRYKPCIHDHGFTDALHLPCGYEPCEGNEIDNEVNGKN